MPEPKKVILQPRNERDKRTLQERTRWVVNVNQPQLGKAGATTRRFKSKKEALDFIATRSMQATGEAPLSKVVSRHTVADSVDAYIEAFADTIDKDSLGPYRAVRALIGDLPINQLAIVPKIDKDKNPINPQGLNRAQLWLKSLEEKPVPPRGPKAKPSTKLLSASTRRKYFYALKQSVLFYAKKNNLAIPATTFETPPEGLPASWENQRSACPSEETLDKIIAHAQAGGLGVPPEVWQRIILFALETAMRLQEIVFAKWSDLVHNGETLGIPRANVKTKGHIPKEVKIARYVPLSPFAQEIIAKQKETLDKTAPQERIFWQIAKPHDVSEAFADIRESAGVSNLTFHDLRHVATTNLVLKTDRSISELMKITGHTNITTFQRYIDLRPSEINKSVANLPNGALSKRRPL